MVWSKHLRSVLVGVAIFAGSAGPAHAAKAKWGKYCSSFFNRVRYDVSAWVAHSAKSAHDDMVSLFLSEDGKARGITPAAEADLRGEYGVQIWGRDNAINVHEVHSPEVEDAFIEFWRSAIARSALGDLGEPIRGLHGETLWKGWGRPQNDSPAYIALRWCERAQKRLKAGKLALAATDYISDLNKPSVKWLLEYIAHHWADFSFDLWEEEKGTHFHTLLIMLDSLEKGVEVAAKLEVDGESSGAVLFYREQIAKIRETVLKNAWDPEKGYLRATWAHPLENGGFVRKAVPLDTAVILAMLHTTVQPPLYRFADDRMLATLEKLEAGFSEIYRFNRQFDDPAFRGVGALGRYFTDLFHGGNPWVITTLAAGEYYFKLGRELLDAAEISINPTNIAFYRRLLASDLEIHVGQQIGRESHEYRIVLAAIEEKADGFADIIRKLTKEDGVDFEQIGRGYEPGDRGDWVPEYLHANGADGSRAIEPGHWTGAKLLVWNKAARISFKRARDAYLLRRRAFGR